MRPRCRLHKNFFTKWKAADGKTASGITQNASKYGAHRCLSNALKEQEEFALPQAVTKAAL
jgi:hypothetical protein